MKQNWRIKNKPRVFSTQLTRSFGFEFRLLFMQLFLLDHKDFKSAFPHSSFATLDVVFVDRALRICLLLRDINVVASSRRKSIPFEKEHDEIVQRVPILHCPFYAFRWNFYYRRWMGISRVPRQIPLFCEIGNDHMFGANYCIDYWAIFLAEQIVLTHSNTASRDQARSILHTTYENLHIQHHRVGNERFLSYFIDYQSVPKYSILHWRVDRCCGTLYHIQLCHSVVLW